MCLENSNITLGISASHPIRNKGTNPALEAQYFFRNNILPIFHPLYMFIINWFCLCPHKTLKIWNFNTFIHKCSFVQDCASSLHYYFDFTLLHFHQPSLCFCHHLHLYGLLHYQLHFYE